MQRTNTTNSRGLEGGNAAAMAPKFFKTITTTEANKLRVPDEIMRRYGHILPNKVWWLHVPIGSTWRVELVQSNNGETWLNNGWQEFKKYYSLTNGQFLLFKYKGNSHFNVLLFDPLACEIEYPIAAIDHDKDINTNQEPEAKDVESESGDINTTPDGKKRPNEYSDDRKMKKLVQEMNDRCPGTIQESKGKKNLKSASGLDSHKMKAKIKSHMQNKAAMTNVNDSASPKLEIVFKKYQRSRVVLPKKFGQYLIGKDTVIMEYVPTRGSKKVLLWHRSMGNEKVRHELASGWNDFHAENGLTFGKSYLFVYNRERNVIRVSPVEKKLQVNVQGTEQKNHIGRKSVTRSDRWNLDPESSSARMKRKYVEISEDQPVKTHVRVKNKAAMTSVFNKSSPHFEMVLKYDQKYQVVLDREFAKTADLFSKEAVVLKYEPTQQCTEVLLDSCSRKQGSCRLELATGRKDFRKQNGLKFGKSYSFVYNRGRNVILVRPVEKELGDSNADAQCEKKKKQMKVLID